MRDVRERRKKGVDFLNQKETDLLLLLLLKHRTGSLSTFNPLLDLGLHIATSLAPVVCCRRVIRSISSRQRQMSSRPSPSAALPPPVIQ